MEEKRHYKKLRVDLDFQSPRPPEYDQKVEALDDLLDSLEHGE